MKGRANYLCRKKLYDLTDQPVLNGLEEINQFRIISDWEKTTQTGDRAEFAETARDRASYGAKLDARTDRCIGAECQQFDRCFITEMRRRAAESDIIIVNHHLFCADLAIKAGGRSRAGRRRPARSGRRGVRRSARAGRRRGRLLRHVSRRTCESKSLLRDVDQTLRRANVLAGEVLAACSRVRERSQFFFSLLPPGDGRFAFENRGEFLEENGDEYLGLQNTLHASLHRAAGDSREAGRGTQPVAPRRGAARAAGLYHGVEPAQHGVLD